MKILSVFLSVLMLSALANAQVVPIIDMKIGGLIGGVRNGEYLSDVNTFSNLLAEQNYTVFSLDGTSEILKLKKPQIEVNNCKHFYAIERNTNERFYEFGGVALGEGFSWNPVPRSVKTVDLENENYKKIVADFLIIKKTVKTEIRLNQVFRADFDGDGVDEDLISATKTVPDDERKENEPKDIYSIVFLRKIVNGKPKDILISGDFYSSSRINYQSKIYHISSILDLNGDGKMEIVLSSKYKKTITSEVHKVFWNTVGAIIFLTAKCEI